MQKRSLALLALAATLGTAHADQASVKATIDKMLDMYVAPSDKIAGYRVSRDYTLEDKGNNTYTATINEFTFVGEKNEDLKELQGLEIPLGPLQITAVENGDLINFDVIMTSKVEVKTKAGVQATINVGSQSTKHVWSQKSEFYTSSITKLGDITTEVQGVKVSIANIDSIYHAKQVNDHWTMPFTLNVGETLVQKPSGESFKVGSMDGKGHIDITDPKEMQSAAEALSKLSQNEKGNDNAFFAALDKLFGTFTKYDMTLTMNNFEIGHKGRAMFTLGTVGIGSDYDYKTDGSSFGLQINANGLKTGLPMLPPGFMPEQLNIEFFANKLPKNFITEMTKSQAEAAAMKPAEREKHNNKKVMAMLSKAGTTLGFKNSLLHSQKVKINLDSSSTLTSNPKVPMTGTAKLAIVGMKDLQQLFAMMGNQKAMAIVAMLGQFSVAKTENGVTTNTLNVVQDKDGTVEINGKDVSALMGR